MWTLLTKTGSTPRNTTCQKLEAELGSEEELKKQAAPPSSLRGKLILKKFQHRRTKRRKKVVLPRAVGHGKVYRAHSSWARPRSALSCCCNIAATAAAGELEPCVEGTEAVQLIHVNSKFKRTTYIVCSDMLPQCTAALEPAGRWGFRAGTLSTVPLSTRSTAAKC